jgi:hypothetical protein
VQSDLRSGGRVIVSSVMAISVSTSLRSHTMTFVVGAAVRGIRGDHTEPDVRAVQFAAEVFELRRHHRAVADCPVQRRFADQDVEAVPAALQDELADNPHVDGLVQVVTSTGDRGAGVQDCVGVVPLRIAAMQSCC